MKIYLYKKHEYFSKYKLFIMKPVIVEADINLLTKSAIKPVLAKNAPGSAANNIYNVNLIDSKHRPVRGIIVYKTKQGARAYLSLIKEHCPYTDTMGDMLESERTNNSWVNIILHKKTDMHICPYIVNPYHAMRTVVVNKQKYYYIEGSGMATLIYIMRKSNINGYDVNTMDYMLMRRNRRELGMANRKKGRVFFDVRYNNQFRRLYDFSKIGNSVIDVFDNEGTAIAVNRDIITAQYSFMQIHFLLRNPGREYMLENWHKSSSPAINTPHYLFNDYTYMSFADDFTVIDKPEEAVSILSRVSNSIFLPKDKPAKPSYEIRHASGDFLLGYPEVNGVQ